MGYSAQPIARQSTTIKLDQVFGIDFEWDDYEAVVKAERSQQELEQNYLEPAAAKLSQELESRAALFAYQNTPNVFGALGTNPTTATPFLDADTRLFDKSAPDGDRKMIISSRMMSSVLGGQSVQFNPSSEISRQYKKGTVGQAFGFDWYRSNSLYRHTIGTAVTALQTNAANQSGSSLVCTGTTGQTLKKGDKISINNVNFVNPNTLRVPAGNQVAMFTVTEDCTVASSAVTIPIYPAIVGPGSPYQNVDALPGASAAITLWPGTSSPSGKSGTVGLALTKNAFGLAYGSFKMPKMVEPGSTMSTDPATGATIRFTRQWSIEDGVMKNRFDMCVGFGVLYADECAVAIAGA
jgi:cytochrome c oxidase assembly protein Cox11